MAVNMNFIPYSPLPPKPPMPHPTKHHTPEHRLPQPVPLPSAQFIPEPPLTHSLPFPPPCPPLPFCRDARKGPDSQIGGRDSSALLNEFDAELERWEVVEVVDMSSPNSTDQGAVEPSSPRTSGFQGRRPFAREDLMGNRQIEAATFSPSSTAPGPKPCRDASSGKTPQKAGRSSSQEIVSPLPDSNTMLDESEAKASCQPPGLVDSPDQLPYSSAKLPVPEGSQEHPILIDLKSGEKDSPNSIKSKIIGPAVRTSATDRGIADSTSSSTDAESDPGTPGNPGKCDGGEHRPMRRRGVRHMGVRVEIPSTPDALQETERRGDRTDPSDDSDNNNSSDCSEDDDDDDHVVTRRSRKRRKLSARSSVSTVSSTACADDPSLTALPNDKKSRSPAKKYYKNPASDSSRVPGVPQDDTVTKHSGDDIPVSGFLSSHLSGSKVCYTITFYHQDAGRPLSVKANGLSRPSRKKQQPVATGMRVPFASEDDALLKELKEEGKPWDEIAKRFPGRSKATLQVRYSTKLKDRAPSRRKSKPRKHGCR
ncbi:predicted protein [Histoplasma mississippiense (nom. inval.)]|uniref:predicted protein n=1 Tax=Ajellomyces capsulatus (strain NAm1 / WU24) TaxID=2059318 RepID=UPI000157B77F|nr:predicted protein [Histoplasma mississippiense (nom. inval.)]EDN03896.1 predicted protein [Histoplasma mississippiense (nom. inval.)]